MIYTLTITNPKKTPIPHWHQVPWLKGKKSIEFQPGLNIVYGPNGSGKSTLLAGLATLTHCKEENWPRVTKASLTLFLRPVGLADGLMITHDGMPCRYLGLTDPAAPPEKGIKEKTIELASLTTVTATKALHQQSSGQASLTKLVRFLRSEPQKVKYAITEAKLDGSWKKLWKVGVAGLKNVSDKGFPKQQTLLLDEIDTSLDFAKQAAVWKQLRTIAADGEHQIIIASHSCFAVNQPGAHYIETAPGYLDDSRKALNVLLRDAA